jgi:hypothetical protein
MQIDYHIFIPLIPFALGIFLKTLLDFNFAIKIVRWLHWIPVRSIFRLKVHNISGEWKQQWINTSSPRYPRESDTLSSAHIWQFGKYCYGEFNSLEGNEYYYFFGEIIDRQIIGKWSDRKTLLGYYGAFELRIVDENKLEGVWLGHSNTNPNQINKDRWIWNK